jgi:hypothetical protein
MQSYHNATLRIAELESMVADRDATIARRAYDPCWQITGHIAVNDEIAMLPADLPVKAVIGDVKDLKVWNTAMGSQPPLDAVMRRGFQAAQLRAGDIFGRGDSADHLYIICPDAPDADGRRVATDAGAVAAKINEALRTTPLRAAERARYVRGACAKRYGPWIGRIYEWLHYRGIRRIVDYPMIDWQPVADGCAGGLVARMEDADEALFAVKAGH